MKVKRAMKGTGFLVRTALLVAMASASTSAWGQTAPVPSNSPAPATAAMSVPAKPTLPQTDWAALKRYADANAALPADVPGRVVFYGDSITDAWTRNGGKFFPGKPYVNRGISGQTTPQMLVRFRQDVIDLHPTAVVILAGTNDIAGNTGAETQEQIEGYFRSMVELAKQNNIRVVISSLLPAADYPWRRGLEPSPRIIALNKWLQEYCASEHLVYLDYYTSMAMPDGSMKKELTLDGVHPNAAGYAVMESLAQPAVNAALAAQ